jgi:uncharacterized protein YqjF (DUF2071 family)
MPRPFLTARWENLVILNFDVPRRLLDPLVPQGTHLDLWQGDAVVSLVGFYFADTRVLGMAFPGRNFEEVNLRFYVRRHTHADGDRRAVVFIRELVPRRAIALAARLIYNEPYLAVPMNHRTRLDPGAGGELSYSWRYRDEDFALTARVANSSQPLEAGSEAEFITEHYWGYTRQRDGGTLEYKVEHPRWRVWTTPEVSFQGPALKLYGIELGTILTGKPRSAFVADGSAVIVHGGRLIA